MYTDSIVTLTVDGNCENFRAKLVFKPPFSYKETPEHQQRDISGWLLYRMHGNQFNTKEDKLTPELEIEIREHKHLKDGGGYCSYDLVSLEGDMFAGKTVGVVSVRAGHREAGNALTVPPGGSVVPLKL
jgi:hypothetical protein